MADRAITLEIVTPEGVRLAETVQAFTAPSVDGQFGVLPGHRPMLAALATGIVSCRTESGLQEVAVGPGFVELFEDRAVLLTDRFITKADVDPVRARLELKEADEELERLHQDSGSPEYARALGRELWAAAQLELYGDPPPPTVHTMSEFAAAPKADYVSDGLPAAAASEPAREQ